MKILSRVGAAFAAMQSANRYEALFSMNDRELAARGLRRKELTRHYVSGISFL
ncbi:MAG: DUF1127 domain-containing protein [Pseudomonadota bacterium]